MLLAGAESIREVIAFPKTLTAYCPLTGAPSRVSPRQLDELGIALRLEPEPEAEAGPAEKGADDPQPTKGKTKS